VLPERWTVAFAGHENAHAELKVHCEQAGGIAREYVNTRATSNPMELFLMLIMSRARVRRGRRGDQTWDSTSMRMAPSVAAIS
jgi:hypothetical protein